MANHFHLEEASTFTTQTYDNQFVAATRLTCDRALYVTTKPIALEPAYIVEWQVGSSNAHALRSVREKSYEEPHSGQRIGIVDLEYENTANLNAPFDCLHFYLPRQALREMAREQGAAPIDRLEWPKCKTDTTIDCLGGILLSALQPDASVCTLFRDYLLLALAAHFAMAYGGLVAGRMSSRGGLAPWQLRRATELLTANIDGDIPLSTLAAECRLSVSHFARAFRRSSGKAPHRWLIERRVHKAKDLLAERKLALAEISLQCGFSEQAAFTRTFKREVGTSPGVWRKLSQL